MSDKTIDEAQKIFADAMSRRLKRRQVRSESNVGKFRVLNRLKDISVTSVHPVEDEVWVASCYVVGERLIHSQGRRMHRSLYHSPAIVEFRLIDNQVELIRLEVSDFADEQTSVDQLKVALMAA